MASPPKPPAVDNEVKETHTILRETASSGHKIINKYMVFKELGRGVHGKVKLGVDVETGKKYVGLPYDSVTFVF